MSFPFYNRLSSKASRSKESKSTSSKHASASFATGAFNLSETSRAANSNSHTRTSSKIRIIPFLGKRRKSLATLRPTAIAEEDRSTESGGVGCRHNKTVSQLANETAARFARSSFGAAPAGSRSTGNLELTEFDSSPLKLGLGSTCTTPMKIRPAEARHTMFPSGKTQNSTPDKISLARNKHGSEKPTKSSFLSRISSRPALSSRYSSADLKSTSKARMLFKSPEKHQDLPVAPQRKEIIHPVHMPNRQTLVDDKDFFTSPRTAPTPPNLRFASPDSSLLDSPLDASRSIITLPSTKQSPLVVETKSARTPAYDSVRYTSGPQVEKHHSSSTTMATPASLSPERALKSPRRHSTSDQNASPSVASQGAIASGAAAVYQATRPRGSHVRIGKEKVTLSVANMLEAELGVEVGDSEDSSYYDDSYEDSRRAANRSASSSLCFSSQNAAFKTSSDLPPLSPADDLNLSFKFPKFKERHGVEFELEAQSPLSALMTPMASEVDCSLSASSGWLRHSSRNEAGGEKQRDKPEITEGQRTVDHGQARVAQQPRSGYLHSLGSQSREVDHLDRISERSVSVRQESPPDSKGNSEKSASESDSADHSAIASQLRRALDVQRARFDKLAGQLLQIIQRHQTEKVQLESQITVLQNEARRNEREIKALRKLITKPDKRSSQEGWNTRRLVRIASMQSFLSSISVSDEEVDMSVAVEMLARAGRRNPLLSPDISRDVRASMDLSPCPPPTRVMTNGDLRRSKTMPDLHKKATATSSPVPSTPQDATSDVSGLGLGLDFPLPEPLKLASIGGTIMSSAKDSSASVPGLTAAPTVASGLSLATEPSVNGCEVPKSGSVGRGSGRSVRQKRMAGEWKPGGIQNLYRHYKQSTEAPSGRPTREVPDLPASTSYANNLNKALVTTPIGHIIEKDSPDLDAIYNKIVSSSNGLLG